MSDKKEVTATEVASEAKQPEAPKKVKKITKSIEGNILTITAGTEVMTFDVTKYSAKIQDHLKMHGLSQKLGDGAASAENSVEAATFIKKVDEGLMKDDWTTRAPAGEKVSKKSILEKYEGLSAKEKAIAAPLLRQLGLIA